MICFTLLSTSPLDNRLQSVKNEFEIFKISQKKSQKKFIIYISSPFCRRYAIKNKFLDVTSRNFFVLRKLKKKYQQERSLPLSRHLTPEEKTEHKLNFLTLISQ